MEWRKGKNTLTPTTKMMEEILKRSGYVEVEKSASTLESAEDLTKKEIMQLLDEKGIEYNDRDKKADLFELLKEG